MADPTCSEPLQTGDTDGNGEVALSISTGNSPPPLALFLEFHKEGWLDDLLLLNTPPLSYDFDVGTVSMDALATADQLATAVGTLYDPSLAIVKVRVVDCNLRPAQGIDLTWADRGEASINFGGNWDVIAVNVPVPRNLLNGVVARLTTPAASQDAAGGPIVAKAPLVVRGGAITLAPFVTPTPL